MDYLWIGIGIVALWLLNRLILAPFRKLAVNIIVGLVVLYLVNTFGGTFGFQHVPITWVTGIIIGIFGLPGVLGVTLYYTFF